MSDTAARQLVGRVDLIHGTRDCHITPMADTVESLSRLYKGWHTDIFGALRTLRFIGSQLEHIEAPLEAKCASASAFQIVPSRTHVALINEPKDCRLNYWLNAIFCENEAHRSALLETTSQQGGMMRPTGTLMNHPNMHHDCRRGHHSTAEWFGARVVNLTSSVVIKWPP